MIEFHEDDNWRSTRVLEGRALRARSEPDWRARRRRAPPSTLPVVPLENIEFPLVRPVFDTRDIAMTYRIVFHVLPFLFVRFCGAQLAVPNSRCQIGTCERFVYSRVT